MITGGKRLKLATAGRWLARNNISFLQQFQTSTGKGWASKSYILVTYMTLNGTKTSNTIYKDVEGWTLVLHVAFLCHCTAQTVPEMFKELAGSTVRPIRSLNTTLQTNFRGTYEKKNPCTNTEIETSSYVASHELHHHTRGDNWSDYTDKCSAIVSNFLQTIGNLIKFNHKPNGSFNFYLNTSISQKQNISGNQTSCDCLPTIVIEATDCKIPLNGNSQISDNRNRRNKALKDKFTNEAVPSSGIPGQQDAGNPKIILAPCPVTFASEETVLSAPLTYTAPEYPARKGGESFEENFPEDDNLSVSVSPIPEVKFSKTSPSEPLGEMTKKGDFSPEVFYDLTKDTQFTYEPKTTYFKTSLRLTPQTDPENGTVKPKIHYIAANVVTNPFQYESAPQSQATTSVISENSFPQPRRPEAPLPRPERPKLRTEDKILTAPSYNSTQVPTSVVGPIAPQSFNQNESAQLSMSKRSELPLLPTELQPAKLLLNTPAAPFVPRDQVLVNPINDPEFPTVSLQSQTTAAPNLNRQMPATQFRPVALFDTPQTINLPKSSPVDQNQPTEILIPKPSDEPMPSQFSQVATLPLRFVENQVGTQQISTPPQQLPAQQPYDNRVPSTIPPPTDISNTYEENAGPLLLASETKPVQNYFDHIPQENGEQNDDMLITINQPSVVPPGVVSPPAVSNLALGLPYLNSSMISSPGPDERTVPLPAIYPLGPSLDFNIPNTYVDTQPSEKFRSSSVTTSKEETITTDQQQTISEPAPQPYSDLYEGQIPEGISNSSGSRFNSEPDLHPYQILQESPLISAGNPQPLPPLTNPFSGSNVGDFTQLLTNSKQSISFRLPMTPKNPEKTEPKDDDVLITPSDFRPESSFSTPDYSLIDSQKSDMVFNPNNNQIRVVPEASISVPFQQTVAPEYNLQSGGSPLLQETTPRPYASTLDTEQTALNSLITSRRPPAAAGNHQDAGLTLSNDYPLPTQQTSPPSEPNYQWVSQQLAPIPQGVVTGELTVNSRPDAIPNSAVLNYKQVGSKEQFASDSLVSSDYQTTAAPQPFSNDISSFQPLLNPPFSSLSFLPPNSLSGSSSPYDSASVSQTVGTQFDFSDQEEISEAAPIVEPTYYGLELRPPPTDSEDLSSDLVKPVIPSPNDGSLRPVQQPFPPAVGNRFRESPPSQRPLTHEISPLSEPPKIGDSKTVLSQVQLDDSSHVANTGQDFLVPQSATPNYVFQSSEQNVQAQILEKQFNGGQQTEQTADPPSPFQPNSLGLFPGSGDPSVQRLPAFARAGTFSENIDTTPANFPSAAKQSDQDGLPAFPNRFAATLPAADRSPEVGVQQPNLQALNSSDQLNFNSQRPPAYFSDMTKFQSQVPAQYSAQPEPVILLREFSSPLVPPYQAPFHAENVSPAPFFQDAPVSTDTTSEYTGFNRIIPPPLQTRNDAENFERVSNETSKLFFFPSQPQPFKSNFPPLPSLDRPPQTRPQQVPDFIPVIETTAGNNQKLQVPFLSETSSMQSVTYPQVSLADEIIPTTKEPVNSEMQYLKEITVKPFARPSQFASTSADGPERPEVPKTFASTSPALQAYLNDGLYLPVAFKPQSDDSAVNLPEAINNERELQPNSNDFYQVPAALFVPHKDVDTSPSSFPQPQDFTSYHPTITEETTTESITNSDQFYGDNTQVSLRELPQPVKITQNVFLDNTPPHFQPSAGENQQMLTTQQQFLSPVPGQPLSYADQRLNGLPNSFAPVVPPNLQQIPQTLPPLTPAQNFDSSSLVPAAVGIPDQKNIASSSLPFLTPETPPTYPSQMPSSDGDNQDLPYVNSVKSPQPQKDIDSPTALLSEGPITYNEDSQGGASQMSLSRGNLDSDKSLVPSARDQRLPETFDSTLNQDKPYNQPPPVAAVEPITEPVPNSNIGDRPNLLPSIQDVQPEQYPAFNRPLFYPPYQGPLTTDLQPAFSPPFGFPQNSESGLIRQEPGGSETSLIPPTQMPLTQVDAVSNDGIQLARSGERPPTAFSPVYPSGMNIPDDQNLRVDPSQVSNFNTDRSEIAPPGYFKSPASSLFPTSRNQQVEPPNDPDVGMENVDPSTLVNNDTRQGREVEVPFEDQIERSGSPSQSDSRVEFTPFRPPARPQIPPALSPDLPPHTNPLLQALESHLAIPLQEHLYQPLGSTSSFPGRSDQKAAVSINRKVEKESQNTLTYPAGWNQGPSKNFVNSQDLQPNTAFDTPQDTPIRPQPDPHALVPGQTTPSYEPGIPRKE